MTQYEMIDKFLFGLMSKEEEQDFLNQCKTNKRLRKKAVYMAYLVKALKTMKP